MNNIKFDIQNALHKLEDATDDLCDKSKSYHHKTDSNSTNINTLMDDILDMRDQIEELHKHVESLEVENVILNKKEDTNGKSK